MKDQSCRQFARSLTRLGVGLGVAVLAAATAPVPAQAETFAVKLNSPQFTLYTDPYNGNEVEVGGFSGLLPVPGEASAFYVITDRGPNPDFISGGVTRKIFVRSDFGPHILTVRLQPNGIARIDEAKPLKKPGSGHITGLANSIPAAEAGFDLNLNLLAKDEDGLDTEGLAIDPWGNFWVCEEYKPSVAMVAPNGKVQLRLVPAGTLTGLETVPTFEVLPGILAKRRTNRGLEGIAAASDGILYAIMQRPLNNPNQTTGNASRNIRLVAINLHALFGSTPEVLVRQLIYRTEANSSPANVLLSDIFSVSPSTFLVPERATDKLFRIDISTATDVTALEGADGRLQSDSSRTLEMLSAEELAALGVITVSKTVVLDSMKAIDPALDKCEGVCLVGNTLLLTHDNDFNLEVATEAANPGPAGPLLEVNLQPSNHPKIFTVALP